MLTFSSKPTDKLIKDYYAVLGQYSHLNVEHESAVRSAFQSVLRGYSKKMDWTLVPEYAIQKDRTHRIVVDGALLDFWKQRRGFWEAKDEHDDLEREIKLKLEKGYPRTNIIFQAPERAVIFQHGIRQGLNEDITDPKNLSDLLTHFFSYREPDHEEWDSAVAEFKERIPELAEVAKQLIEGEKKTNRKFRETFEGFYSLCREAINPNLSETAVETMLVQHLLTERIFSRVFHAGDFSSRNVIASEIEKVIRSMTVRHFSRDEFLRDLDRFYKALERAADDKEDYTEKQAFLNTVYENFFQRFSPKEADTHGIVYTPQPIVDFMVRSVDDILKNEFGKTIADRGVHVLDPFVGTGNFITRIIRQIGETRKSALPHKFEHELHCNEIMLLPYYIASMNIEHEYLDQIGEYRPFEGICLVDTFELAEPEQASLAFMNEENTARVKRQKGSPIFVVIGNPPYNAQQADASENNKNRKYPEIDRRIANTYAHDSSATLRNSLSDPYVKAIRWATDRIGEDGIVALVTNNSFIEGKSFDGMRKHIKNDFSTVLVIDLGGDVRSNPKLSGTTNNVFGIQVGVAITLFIRNRAKRGSCEIKYVSTGTYWRKEQKYSFLNEARSVSDLDLATIVPDGKSSWITDKNSNQFFEALCISADPGRSIFEKMSNGIKTNRDAWAYSFSPAVLASNIQKCVDFYNAERSRWIRAHLPPESLDDFLKHDDQPNYVDRSISWSRGLRNSLLRDVEIVFDSSNIRRSRYRPFTTQSLYFDPYLTEERLKFQRIFPVPACEKENMVIAVTGHSQIPFSVQVTDCIPCVDVGGRPGQCFPFYMYDGDGSNRRENITDWALEEFRKHYADSSITKWDIFHYTYALLHSPEYRESYAANLKHELPRIPFAPNFRAFADAGKRLAEFHVNYEQQPEYPLEQIWKPGSKLDMRVERMRLGKDKASLIYNDSLTLSGIPAETFEYRLGNRSALDWVIDQYQVSTDKRSGITNDPNREDDPEYILRLIGQVIFVSLETVKIVNALPELGIGLDEKAHT